MFYSNYPFHNADFRPLLDPTLRPTVTMGLLYSRSINFLTKRFSSHLKYYEELLWHWPLPHISLRVLLFCGILSQHSSYHPQQLFLFTHSLHSQQLIHFTPLPNSPSQHPHITLLISHSFRSISTRCRLVIIHLKVLPPQFTATLDCSNVGWIVI